MFGKACEVDPYRPCTYRYSNQCAVQYDMRHFFSDQDGKRSPFGSINFAYRYLLGAPLYAVCRPITHNHTTSHKTPIAPIPQKRLLNRRHNQKRTPRIYFKSPPPTATQLTSRLFSEKKESLWWQLPRQHHSRHTHPHHIAFFEMAR